jgi:hypothetical protein
MLHTPILIVHMVGEASGLVIQPLSIRAWCTPPPPWTPSRRFGVLCLAAAQGPFAHALLPLRASCQLVCVSWALPRAYLHFHMLAKCVSAEQEENKMTATALSGTA